MVMAMMVGDGHDNGYSVCDEAGDGNVGYGCEYQYENVHEHEHAHSA